MFETHILHSIIMFPLFTDPWERRYHVEFVNPGFASASRKSKGQQNQHPLPQMECTSSELTTGEVVQNPCPKLRETVQWQMSKKDEKKSAESRDVKPLKNGESPVDETSS